MNKNNNPGNVKWADPADHGQLWKGSEGYDERGHARFADAPSGYRAMMRVLQRKWVAGKRMLVEIIAGRDDDGDGDLEGGWAPARDTIGSLAGMPQNNPREYAHYIAMRAGVGIEEALPDPSAAAARITWCRIMAAMTRYETGTGAVWVEVELGYAMWRRDFCEFSEG